MALGNTPAPLDAIDQLVDTFIADNNVSALMLGLMGPGDLNNVTRSYGTLAPTETTIFEIGSVTKTFTCTALAWLAALNPQLGLGFDSVVQDFVPEYPDGVTLPVWNGSVQIMFNELADFTPGFPPDESHVIPGRRTYQELFKWISDHPDLLVAEPGTTYGYSDAGFEILGSVLANANGQGFDYGALLASMLQFSGLSMPDTTVSPSSAQQKRMVQGYRGSNAVDYAEGDWLIVSTMADMMQWLQFNMGTNSTTPLAPLRSDIFQPWFKRSNNHSTGLGWFIDTLPSGETRYSKNGAAEGFTSYIAYLQGGNLSENIGVMILTNQKLAPAPVLGNNILRLMSGVSEGTLQFEREIDMVNYRKS